MFKKFKLKIFSTSFVIAVAAFFVVAAAASAVTTIGVNISTDGTLSVTGAAAFNGNVTLGDTADTDTITFTGYVAGTTNQLVFEGTADAFETFFVVTDATADRTITFQNNTGIVPLGTAANTLFFTTTGATDLTLPTTGTLSTLAGVETLSNKTLTAPKIANAGYIADANGNELFIFTTTAAAVNELTFANAATGNNPTFTISGGDANIGLGVTVKGTGEVVFGTTTTNADTIKILPAAGGGATFAGQITSADLTAARTWTFPNVSGTIITSGDSNTITRAMLASGVLPAIVSGGTTAANAGATYIGHAGHNAAEANVSTKVPYACTGRNLYVDLSGDVGTAGKNMVFTLVKNGVNTAVTCTVAGGAGTEDSCLDTSNSVSFAAGDTWVVAVTIAGTPNATFQKISFECSI